MKTGMICALAFVGGFAAFVAIIWALGCFAYWGSNPIDQWSDAGRGVTGVLGMFVGICAACTASALRECR